MKRDLNDAMNNLQHCKIPRAIASALVDDGNKKSGEEKALRLVAGIRWLRRYEMLCGSHIYSNERNISVIRIVSRVGSTGGRTSKPRNHVIRLHPSGALS